MSKGIKGHIKKAKPVIQRTEDLISYIIGLKRDGEEGRHFSLSHFCPLER
jgi:hypothetical protein